VWPSATARAPQSTGRPARLVSFPPSTAAELVGAADAHGEPRVAFGSAARAEQATPVYAPSIGGAQPHPRREPAGDEQPVETRGVPILMYHRITDEPSPRLGRFVLMPDRFEAQLEHLRREGYVTASLDELRAAARARRPLPGRRVLLTFDDGTEDFFHHAAPLLERHGFTATVFLVADRVGGVNAWDVRYGEEVALMTWSQIAELRARGFAFGSHSATHPALTGLPAEGVVRELARSRRILRERLGDRITAVAYPYGDVDPVVQRWAGGCGYEFGLRASGGRTGAGDSVLALPRIEVRGEVPMQDFIGLLAP
jgi:peptidoglycan/xylan/chitin deacetylase (PgdA/CDA1 family)